MARWEAGGDWDEGCATECPQPDYSDPDQPYFWDHTTMSN